MDAPKHIVTYLDPDVYVALRRRAMASGESFKDLVSQAVEVARQEDEEDRAAFGERVSESVVDLAEVAMRIRSDGR